MFYWSSRNILIISVFKLYTEKQIFATLYPIYHNHLDVSSLLKKIRVYKLLYTHLFSRDKCSSGLYWYFYFSIVSRYIPYVEI